ncbi:MAG: hypothetical protein KatS3mg109_0810 [Pirellulaceae bacterium]|nr:MAG: hypothetical protein KatS3mg109_0810 [Pirellulaceae bacterium]
MAKEPPGPDPERTDLSLLGKTQAYLRALLERRAPDSLLTAAWDEFYRRYDQLIRRYIEVHGVADTEVDDCVQEVWLAIAKYLVDFRHPVKRPGLRAWLYQLVHSKTADVLRSRRRFPKTGLVADELTKDPSGRTIWDDIFTRIILEELACEQPPLRSEIFRLRFFDGLSTRQVADRLAVGPHVVRYHFRRMLQMVRRRVSVFAGAAVQIGDPTNDESDAPEETRGP